MGESDGLSSAGFERDSTLVISPTCVRSFPILKSVCLSCKGSTGVTRENGRSASRVVLFH